jgi:hypothetical protein
LAQNLFVGGILRGRITSDTAPKTHSQEIQYDLFGVVRGVRSSNVCEVIHAFADLIAERSTNRYD